MYFHFPHYYATTTPVSAIRAGDWKLLEYLEEVSLRPGCTGVVTAAAPDGTLTIEIHGRRVGVGSFTSERVLVTT